ncbi:bifunctional pyr operon transcriptional regulator/uracil phosphoribosyltransferase PyrR [Anaeromyxobacter sp. PSR-1]|uniref:bifunctional pyr operon transcriptional regulator/uracil phosphoribosyltransferase PyrR n=1 Tax=unclassified Anaeromyxobacter TaxID=2620896 RepID=UPI0005E7E312|nr:bifunctional pyr operon transcriptional regulator/uracil phosphoribosyltransferase PyrR [Anaeromyxobacter sp. PSR-1]GAO02842.1 bifunctional protein PyrR [Anaeromyxobacter sp. PSR-1]
MNAAEIERAVRRLGRDIAERARAAGAAGDVAIVGIRRGGVHLAQRLRRELARELGAEPPLGTLDIALYRDDLAEKGAAPVIGPTDVRFPVQGKTLVLVDDVLYTGRTVRAALDEIVDFGRPRRVWLAVLVDRGGRELPISADFAGARLEVSDQDDVQVRLVESGAPEDAVVVKPRRAP